MTDLGLTPSLCHLGEYPLQKYTLLHLCVIVPNLAEMFLLGHLQNSISSFPLSPLSPGTPCGPLPLAEVSFTPALGLHPVNSFAIIISPFVYFIILFYKIILLYY